MSINSVIVFPTLNESRRIAPALRDYLEVLDEATSFLVVDNGSTDNTVSVVKNEFGEETRVDVLTFEKPLGKGGAVYAGFDHVLTNEKYKDVELVGFSDADGATPAKMFQELLDQAKNVDVVIASRWVKGANMEVRQSFVRRLTGRMFNVAVNVLFGLRIKDTQCGAKVLRRDAYLQVRDELKLTNFSFDVDLLWRCRAHGLEILEHPIYWRHTEEGSTFSTWKSGPIALFDLVKLRIGLVA